MSLYWRECPHCERSVYVVDGRIANHLKPPLKRRWPKWPEACAASGLRVELEAHLEPLLEM